MSEAVRRQSDDPLFFVLLIPLAAASLPSLIFCLVEMLLWLHGAFVHSFATADPSHRNLLHTLLLLRSAADGWIARWNAAVTLAATALVVVTLLRSRWRTWAGLALIPYGLLLCADFTLRWRSVLHP